MSQHRTRVVLLLAAASLTGGCTVGPDYVKPEIATPAGFTGTGEGVEGLTSRPEAQAADEPLLATWWHAFNDPALTSLIERARTSNLDLRIAESRVREARALRGVVASESRPTVDAGAAYSRSRTSENSPGGFGQNRDSDLFQLGFDAGWELDVFGRVRRAVEAAEADIDAAEETRRDVLVTLLSEVARNYAELRSAQARISIAEESVRVERDLLALSTTRFEAGLTSELDVAQSRAQLMLRRAQIPPLQAEASRIIYRLSVLLGQPPAALVEELSPASPLPAPPATLSLGVPSDLLRRRPDVRQAERQLAAATARIGVAEGDLFPRFSITGALGLEAENFGDLGNGGSGYWSIRPAVRWPILAGGRIRSNIRVQNERQEQALTNYEASVLLALEDTESALVGLVRSQEQQRALEESVVSNRRAVELATQLYRSGLADFLRVLESQRSLYEAEDALAQSKLGVVGGVIAVYKALGGGWGAELAPVPAPDAGESTLPAEPAPTP